MGSDNASEGEARTHTSASPKLTQMDDPAAKRAFLASLPCAPDEALTALQSVQDVWWVAAASVAAIRMGTDWHASDAVRVVTYALEQATSLDEDVYAQLKEAKQASSAAPDAFLAWLDAEPERVHRVLLRRKLWHMLWLLSIPLASSKTATVQVDMASLADTPLLDHARHLCLAGNARGLLALVGAHATVARSLFPHRFALLHTLLTAGGVAPASLAQWRLLPGTRMPVEDRESGIWVDALAAPTPSSPMAAALWVEHPIVVTALAQRSAATHPVVPPPPPPALLDWYTDVVQELEEHWGLVDAASALAQAGVRLGLVSLQRLAQELDFLHMLVYQLGLRTWRLSTLRHASLASLVSGMTAQSHHPRPPAALASLLHESLLPYIQASSPHRTDTMPSESAMGVEMALDVWEARGAAPALPIVHAMLQRTWIAHEDQVRLTLALLGASDEASASAYTHYAALLATVPSDDAMPVSFSPLVRVLAPQLPLSARALWDALAMASPPMLDDAWRILRIYVEVGRVCTQHGAPLSPQACWRGAFTTPAQTASLAKALVQHTLQHHRGRERPAMESLCAALAPWLGEPPRMPPSLVRALFRQLLLAREPILFNEVVSRLPHTCPTVATYLTADEAEALVLETTHAWIAQATTCDPLHGPLLRARETLDAAPHTEAIRRELAFLALVGQLHTYALPSLSPSEPGSLTPQQVRAMPHKLELLARVLSLHTDAYRAPHILDVGRACSEAPDDDVRVAAMLADAAAASGDLRAARAQCDQLVVHTRALSRTEHAAAWDVAWRTCFQLAKHPQWTDARARASVLGQALTLAPPEHIPTVLQAWQEWAPFTGAPSLSTSAMSRRADRSTSLARLLTRPAMASVSTSHAPPRGRTAQLFDSVAEQHAPQAAQLARQLLGNFSAGWWGDDKASRS